MGEGTNSHVRDHGPRAPSASLSLLISIFLRKISISLSNYPSPTSYKYSQPSVEKTNPSAYSSSIGTCFLTSLTASWYARLSNFKWSWCRAFILGACPTWNAHSLAGWRWGIKNTCLLAMRRIDLLCGSWKLVFGSNATIPCRRSALWMTGRWCRTTYTVYECRLAEINDCSFMKT